jgi:hypothetical protein
METRDDWGYPKLLCSHCNGWIYTSDTLVIDGDFNYHGECYDELRKPKVETPGDDS